jgi:ABC-type sugar transport system ATPase subunit
VQPLLVVEGLSSPGVLDGASLHVQPGEVLGVGGLVGAGRSELLDAIFGIDRRATGRVGVAGRRIPRGDPRASMAAGIGYVPEDRRLQGLFFQLGVGENIILPEMPRLARAGVRAPRAERSLISSRIVEFRVKASSPAAVPGTLSGGNQQKLLIARWMHAGSRVLLLDEPTRGIDVGTKAEVYRLIRAAAERGAAILLVSSDMPELLHLSDRLIVLADGRVTGELAGPEMTQENVLRLATREAATT